MKKFRYVPIIMREKEKKDKIGSMWTKNKKTSFHVDIFEITKRKGNVLIGSATVILTSLYARCSPECPNYICLDSNVDYINVVSKYFCITGINNFESTYMTWGELFNEQDEIIAKCKTLRNVWGQFYPPFFFSAIWDNQNVPDFAEYASIDEIISYFDESDTIILSDLLLTEICEFLKDSQYNLWEHSFDVCSKMLEVYSKFVTENSLEDLIKAMQQSATFYEDGEKLFPVLYKILIINIKSD